MLVHLVNVGKREVAAPDAGLVRDDEQLIAGYAEFFQPGARRWKNVNVFGTAQIIPFGNHRPVAVEKYGPVHRANCGWFLARMELNYFPALSTL
jgi:hypothetical protein